MSTQKFGSSFCARECLEKQEKIYANVRMIVIGFDVRSIDVSLPVQQD